MNSCCSTKKTFLKKINERKIVVIAPAVVAPVEAAKFLEVEEVVTAVVTEVVTEVGIVVTVENGVVVVLLVFTVSGGEVPSHEEVEVVVAVEEKEVEVLEFQVVRVLLRVVAMVKQIQR